MIIRNINTCQLHHHQQQQQQQSNDRSKMMMNGDGNIGINNEIYSNFIAKKLTNLQHQESTNVKKTTTTSSGSETDISTTAESTTEENLSSPEEHFLLLNTTPTATTTITTRQEPQGEESISNIDCLNNKQSILNNNNNNNNTLIIHGNNSLNNSINSYLLPYIRISDSSANVNTVNQPINFKNFKNNNVIPSPYVMIDDNPYSNLNLLNYQNTDKMANDNVIKPTTTDIQQLQQPMLNDYLNSLKNNTDGDDSRLIFKNFNLDNLIDQSLPLLPPPSSMISNFKQQQQQNIGHKYEKSCNIESSVGNVSGKSFEKFTISRSHPDLSKFSDDELIINRNAAALPFDNQQSNNKTIELLLIENQQLRNECDLYQKKVEKFQKFESEIQKIYQSYDELMQSSEKKEKFEREARYRLEIEVKKLQKQNKCLQDQLDANVTKKMNYDESDYEKELNKRGALISYLLMKNKELINYKERQEIELEAQRLTLQEQRNHIEILDTALINAQNNIMTLENELRSKQGWEEKTLFLEKAFSNLQSTNERRLQMEKRIRTYLEKELEKFKNNNNSTGDSQQQQQPSDDVDTLKASIVNYEKRIIDLEAEVSKWEQKYLEENTLRSIEVSAASAPKDAKIAALERTSHESEKLIAEARNERLKHMDEIHIANKKCAELESQLKDLNFKLAEKETIINVLQKHSDDRDAVLQKTIRFTNNVAARHSKSASTMGLVVVGNQNQQNNFNNNQLNKTTSTKNQLKLRTTQNGSLIIDTDSSPTTTSASTGLNLDEQIKEIESSQLTNKDSIINALRNEKERYPNHYNNWRL